MELNVLVLAPVGRDARLLVDALVFADLQAETIGNLNQIIPLLGSEGVGALLVTEEVLNVENIALLGQALEQQPAWSDLPILILTKGGASTKRSRQRERDRLPLGTVMLLERPIRKAPLLSTVKSALRSRRRQYQMRDTLLERDRLDQARRDTESRLATAIETARLGTWELDVSAGELIVSAIFLSQFDLDADEPTPFQAVESRVHKEDRVRRRQLLDSAVTDRRPYTSEYRVVWRDGTVRWIAVNGRPLGQVPSVSLDNNPTDTKGLRFIGVTLDITERVLSERALRNADKLALVGRLSSSIAHEINNPLEAVTNLLYLLSKANLGPEEKGYVITAQQELARVSEITAQTLRFNRHQDAYEEAIVPEIIDSVLALYQGRLLMSEIHVERNYSYNHPFLCHPGELRQIFTNLVGNAFDATRKGGKILVRERLATHPQTGQTGVRITIADTGTGMSPEVQRNVFQAFHSTKGNNGTGLGLWISRGLAEKHGGSLLFRSSTRAHQHGTTFCLFIPLLK